MAVWDAHVNLFVDKDVVHVVHRNWPRSHALIGPWYIFWVFRHFPYYLPDENEHATTTTTTTNDDDDVDDDDGYNRFDFNDYPIGWLVGVDQAKYESWFESAKILFLSFSCFLSFWSVQLSTVSCLWQNGLYITWSQTPDFSYGHYTHICCVYDLSIWFIFFSISICM